MFLFLKVRLIFVPILPSSMSWDWLQSGSGDSIEDALLIHDHISQLPATSATFNLSNIDISNTQYIEKLVVLNDSWLVPDHLSSSRNKRKAVNPGYNHIHYYAEAPVKCRCGAVISRENASYDNERGSCKLPKTCNSLWSSKAHAELWEKRYKIIVQSAKFLRSPDYVATRVGCEKASLTNMSKKLYINRREIREQSRRELEAYVPKLKERYTARELSKIFNRSPSTIRRWWCSVFESWSDLILISAVISGTVRRERKENELSNPASRFQLYRNGSVVVNLECDFSTESGVYPSGRVMDYDSLSTD